MLKHISNQHDVPALNPPVVVHCKMGNMVDVSRQIEADTQAEELKKKKPQRPQDKRWPSPSRPQNRPFGEDPEGDSESTACQISWRNMFSAINMARFLVKLVTNHQHRIVLMHAMKSTLILRRVLKVRQTMFQYYILKLIKCQVRLLGKQWRKSNMKLFYAIYRMLRHR